MTKSAGVVTLFLAFGVFGLHNVRISGMALVFSCYKWWLGDCHLPLGLDSLGALVNDSEPVVAFRNQIRFPGLTYMTLRFPNQQPAR